MVAEVANVFFRIDKPVDDGGETALLRDPRPVLQAVSVRLAREDMAIEPGHRALVRLRFSRLRPAEALHVFVRFRDPANYLANRTNTCSASAGRGREKRKIGRAHV